MSVVVPVALEHDDVRSPTSTPFASAIRWTFSVGDASMSIASAASGPTAILSM